MPEFTYEESDNYMAAQEARGLSDGALKRAYFDCLRAIKSMGLDSGTRLWRDTLISELEKRDLMENGRIINKKKRRGN